MCEGQLLGLLAASGRLAAKAGEEDSFVSSLNTFVTSVKTTSVRLNASGNPKKKKNQKLFFFFSETFSS